tara:strand:+ start:570 stop:788 length:219 start_codon:yes stop_codon:yes gene_type:complete
MRIEVLSTKHYEYMFNKYKMLYEVKFPWAVKQLTDAMIKDHMNRVVLTMDEAEYIKEIQLAGKAKPVDMPSK